MYVNLADSVGEHLLTEMVDFSLFLKSLKNDDGSARWSISQINVIPIGGQAIQVRKTLHSFVILFSIPIHCLGCFR